MAARSAVLIGLGIGLAAAASARAQSSSIVLAPGWPVSMGTPTNGQPYTPTLADVDGDGADEIFVHGGETLALRGDGTFLPGWPTSEMAEMGYGAQGQLPGPSVGDFDGDGEPEVLWALRDWEAGSSRTWTFNARRVDGSDVAGFPQAAPVAESLALSQPFVIGDPGAVGFRAAAAALLPGDGPQQLAFFDAQANRVVLSLPAAEWVVSVNFADLDADGQGEFFALSWSGPTSSISLHVVDGQGREVAGYPKTLLQPGQPTHVGGSAAAADLDGDGDLEVLIGYFGQEGWVGCFHHTGARCAGFPVKIGSTFQVVQLAVGNVAGGASPAQLVVLGWHRLRQTYQLFTVDAATLTLRPGWPRDLPASIHPAAKLPGAPILADLDGDGSEDVVAAHTDGKLHAFSGSGVPIVGFPLAMSGPSISGAATGDVDGDGYLDVVAATWDGWVYRWKTTSPWSPHRAHWPLRGGDARNSGTRPAPGAGQCRPSETTLCLATDRFAVRAHGIANGAAFVAHAVQRTADSGYFWFFDDTNYEVLIKVLDACGLNDRYWVFDALLSDVALTLDVEDMLTGRTYLVRNRQGHQPPAVLNTSPNFSCSGNAAHLLSIDTAALPPAEPPLVSEYVDLARIGPCIPDAFTACLHDGLFRVHAESTVAGVTVAAKVNPLSSASFEALFFGDTNVELAGKVLDGRGLTGSWWVFDAGTTNVAAKVWVENTRTGQVWMQENREGHVFAPALDTSTIFTDGPSTVAWPAARNR